MSENVQTTYGASVICQLGSPSEICKQAVGELFLSPFTLRVVLKDNTNTHLKATDNKCIS